MVSLDLFLFHEFGLTSLTNVHACAVDDTVWLPPWRIRQYMYRVRLSKEKELPLRKNNLFLRGSPSLAHVQPLSNLACRPFFIIQVTIYDMAVSCYRLLRRFLFTDLHAVLASWMEFASWRYIDR